MDKEAIIQNDLDHVLKATNLEELGEKKTGKVRDVYDQKDKLVLISTDRHSSFDRVIAHVPFKGQVLNQLSAFWFEQTRDIVPNHVLDVPDPNVLVAKKCRSLPVEVVVRGYLSGVTSTSLWTHYEKGQRDFGGFTLPEGLRKNQELEQPVLTPTTKSDEHDRPITPREIVAEGLARQELWDNIEAVALKVFARGQKIAAEHGLILVDTKYEFGLDDDGVLTLIDEVHTPDSSRYWKAASYEERFARGEEPEYFDKEFLRLWFRENCDPYKDATLPDAPREMVVELASRYVEIYETITGKAFEAPDLSVETIENRIRRNLAEYMTQ